MSVYYTSANDEYIFDIHEYIKGKYSITCSSIMVNGKEKLLHNEVTFIFDIKDDDIHIICGSHIGTEDFDFKEEDGDDCAYYVEYYHPGLIKQVKERIMNNKTNVICPNCGTKFALPEHEHTCVGVAIGKDSNLGNIYLKPEKENKMTKAEERIEKLKAAGVDTSNFMVVTGADGNGFVFKNENGIPVPVMDNDPIYNSIKESGYVFNRFVDARWITAQMFQMLSYKSWRGEYKGYDAALTSKGYAYQFAFVRDELHRLAKMEREKDKALEERGQFFTQIIIYSMLLDYQKKLRKYIDHIHAHSCKGVKYVRIPGFKYGNDGKGDVFLTDVYKKVHAPIDRAIESFKYGKLSYTQLSIMFDRFMDYNYIPLKYDFRQSNAFRDAYKGLGAYYTCSNLIKFHNCYVHDEFGCLDTERSLKLLKTKAEEYKGEYWRLFAFMKKLISDNGFNPDWR